MKQCPYCNKEFKTWIGVRGHTSNCINNTGEYLIDENEGPIYYLDIKNLDKEQIKNKYPNLRSRIQDINKLFHKKGFNVNCIIEKAYDKESIIKSIQLFYKENNRIPQSRDFNYIKKYPGRATVQRHFKTWNKAIEAAGFEPNIQNGYGINTKANDGIIYRSRYEAEFVNKFLFEKYEYIIEPKYPNPYNKYYDWYISELDLYIELDGEIRPKILQEKIEINKKLNRNLLIVKTKDINKFNTLPKNTSSRTESGGD